MSKPLTYQLSFYPDYLVDRMNLDFSERYHTDPVYRNEQWKALNQWIWNQFGQWGCGEANPKDQYSPTTLWAVHLLAYLFGAPVSYSREQFPDTPIYPLEGLDDLRAFDRKARSVRERMDRLLEDTERLVKEYGAERVVVPFHSASVDGVEDLETTHCPLTIAYKLFGGRILMDIYDDPEGAKFVFSELMEMCLESAVEFRNVIGLTKPRRVLMSACSACFISPSQWEEFLLPLQEQYCKGREAFFHSCGTINHHLQSFGRLAKTIPFVKFDCRESSQADLKQAAAAMPGVELSYMLSPSLCLSRTSQEIRQRVKSAVEEAGNSPLQLILMAPKGTPNDVITAFLDECAGISGKNSQKGFRFV